MTLVSKLLHLLVTVQGGGNMSLKSGVTHYSDWMIRPVFPSFHILNNRWSQTRFAITYYRIIRLQYFNPRFRKRSEVCQWTWKEMMTISIHAPPRGVTPKTINIPIHFTTSFVYIVIFQNSLPPKSVPISIILHFYTKNPVRIPRPFHVHFTFALKNQHRIHRLPT